MDLNSKLFGMDGSINAQYFDASVNTLRIFDKYIANISQSEESQNHGCFKYVSYHEQKFFTQMDKVLKVLDCLQYRGNARFLDVGCGIGTKVFLASKLFSRADGIEFDKNYIRIAQRIFLSSSRQYTANIRFTEIDALQFSFYNDYEVIYLYRPFHDAEKQNRLEAKIARDARTNAIIVGMLCNFYNLPEEIRPEMIFTNAYLKTKDKYLAERIKVRLSDEK